MMLMLETIGKTLSITQNMRLPSLHIVATQDEQLRTCLHNIADTVYEMIATKRNARSYN
jgi:hypothetical protein